MRAHPGVVEMPNMAGLIIGGPRWSWLILHPVNDITPPMCAFNRATIDM
jgi:hypothetical protein